ncbi:CsiV family protein [Aestuariirhabdus litorea]|uniref:Peptidoglycan-binding protein CsiV n=1 Tax=Aestuariirhabdus litorea TaxID=2528527 RepID=A0A3P3VPL7_9GAMM|nr:CsiV family protein [Aestuariirhabdus litorea]RRJ84665.1 hypothetical protein D0544_06060 [Aestuariirhabdus litorea]RWW97889.1 hypothetical protein DZC74_06055 [Endozoicomonadaceae bacterium GTF-13]
MMTRFTLKPALLAAALFYFSPNGVSANEAPEERWFQVEMIVFEHIDPNSDEIWSEEYQAGEENSLAAESPFEEDLYPHREQPMELSPPVAAGEEAAPLVELLLADGSPLLPPLNREEETGKKNQAPDKPLMLLPSDQFTLTTQRERLDKSEAYRVLFHQAWRQPLVESSSAPWIRIEGGDYYGASPTLAGSVSFSLKRYLHIRTRLSLTEFEPFQSLTTEIPDDYVSNAEEQILAMPDSASTSQARGYEPLRRFDLTQSRRMRSSELHYLDSPVMGVLVRLIPFEQPSIEASAPASEISTLAPPGNDLPVQ